MRERTIAAITLLAAGAILAGCTGTSGVNTQDLTTATTSSTISASSSPTVDPPSSAQTPSATSALNTTDPAPPVSAGTEGLSAQEEADRAAVEAQWMKSWNVYLELARTPAAEREALVAAVAVDPTKTNMLTDGAKFDAQGLETYGALGHRISWPQPINGGITALIDDCQDRSQSGSMKTATGDKVTVGVARDHYQGSLVKGDDGVWRVGQVFYLKDEPC